MFIAATQGWLCDQANPPSPEDIGRHMAQIDDVSRFGIPQSMFDEYRLIIAALTAQR